MDPSQNQTGPAGRQQFEDLWTDFLEGDLCATELATLNKLLGENDEWLKEAIEAYRIHRLLGFVGEDDTEAERHFVAAALRGVPGSDEQFVDNVVTKISPLASEKQASANSRRRIFALAAILTVLAGLSFLLVHNAQSPRIAEVIEAEGAVEWTGPGGHVATRLSPGESLRGGTLETLAGDSRVAIRFHDGTEIEISGPTQLTLADRGQKELHLRHGMLTARVEPQPEGRPLRVFTPAAKATVRGTQFDLLADSYASKLIVDEGLVEIERLADRMIREVPAQHQVIAALDATQPLEVVGRELFTTRWRSEIRSRPLYGEWGSGTDGATESLRAMPRMWNPGKPGQDGKEGAVLLHVAGMRVATDDAVPVRVASEARFRVRGRVAETAPVVFGFTLRYPTGGVAGKYVRKRTIEAGSDPSRSRQGKSFDFWLPLADFNELRDAEENDPIGLELIDCWALTMKANASLKLTSMELDDPAIPRTEEERRRLESEVLLSEIASRRVPEDYDLGFHQEYVDKRLASLDPTARERLAELWEIQKGLDPEMANQGASYVKILQHVRTENLK